MSRQAAVVGIEAGIRETTTVWRLRLLTGVALLTALAFRQSGGLIVPDTKLDLTADPGGFLLRALHMWDPSGAGGQLQNQAYGYLFPVGPFHWVLISAGVPEWVVQRLWWATILSVAFLGMWRLTTALGIGVPWSRYLAALLFALSPRFLAEVAVTSVEVWPMAMAPWVLLPLVIPGERSWTWRVSRSALAFALVGGVNAVASGAALVLPALWFVTRADLRHAGRHALVWLASVIAVSSWWLVPLVLLGRFSPPFLDWIENAPVTTAFASHFEALRGTTPWLNYLSGAAGPSWPAGWLTVTIPALIFATAGLALAGLVGLRFVPRRHQAFLGLSVLVGLALVTFGHTGAGASPIAGVAQGQLDGVLAPFRNTHKFELVVRLPLAIGLAALLAEVATRFRRVGLAPWLMPLGAASCLVIVGAPAITATMARPEGYVAIPDYWQETARWLDEQGGAGPNLVVPAAGFADFTWGSTKDDPLQALSSRPFLVRDAVPLGSAGTTRWLDDIERRLQSGDGGDSLSAALESAGIAHLVVRNDLRADAVDTAGGQSLRVHEALAESGLKRVASFGPPVGSPPGLPPESAVETVDQRTRLPYPSVEVFGVPHSTGAAFIPPQHLVLLAGGAEDVADALSALPGSTAAIVGSDIDSLPAVAGSQATSVVSDGNRDREVFFGRASNNRSEVLAPSSERRTGREIDDYVADADAPKTRRGWQGRLTSVNASSSASDANASLRLGPGYGPQAAVDGDPGTAWVSGRFGRATGEWLELHLSEAVDVRDIDITLQGAPRRVADAREVRLDTDGGTTTARLSDTASPQRVRLPRGLTTRIRVTVTEVPDDQVDNGVALAELSLPGIPLGSGLDVPQSPQGEADILLLRRADDGRAGCAQVVNRPLCTGSSSRQPESDGGLKRWVHLATDVSGPITATVVPRPGEAVERLLKGLTSVEVEASSRAVPDAAGRPESAMDGELGTGWVAAPSDERPTLTVTLPRRSTTSRIQLQRDAFLAASMPSTVRVSFDGGPSRLVTVDDEGYLNWPRTTFRKVELEFVTSKDLRSTDSTSGFVTTLPVGVSEVVVPGVDPRGALRASSRTGAACGFGPEVVVNGVAHGTSVAGTVGDVLSGLPLNWTLCVDDALTVPAGTAFIDADQTPEFAPESLVVGSGASAAQQQTAAPVSMARPGPAELVLDAPETTEDSILLVHQNYNDGWVAEDADGTRLSPIRVNGWQQGWVLPRGDGGEVRASFVPDRAYGVGLGLGFVALAATVVACLRRSRGRAVGAPEGRSPGSMGRSVLVLTALVLIAGASGLVAGLLALTMVSLLGSRVTVAAVATASGVMAAVFVAAAPPWPVASAAVDDELVQVLVLVAVAMVVLTAGGPPGLLGLSARRPRRMIGRSTR